MYLHFFSPIFILSKFDNHSAFGLSWLNISSIVYIYLLLVVIYNIGMFVSHFISCFNYFFHSLTPKFANSGQTHGGRTIP